MSRRWVSMLHTRGRDGRDESGAVSIMVAAMVVVLLSLAAIGVDLGNAMNRKQLTQNGADFAALSGAGGLPDTGASTVQAVADSLNHNQPSSDGAEDCNPDAGATITTSMLRDTNEANGEVTFSMGNTQMRVVSPAARVQFGLANVMGFEDTCVQSEATVMVGTPGAEKVFPSFATDGCDWGQRTIFAPASSTTGPSFEPNLRDEFDSHKNITTFDLTIENPSPDSVPVNPPATTVTLRGTHLETVTKIGFFQEDTGAFQTIPKSSFDTQNSATITITLPDDLPTLTTAAGLWWVRVYAPKLNPTDTTLEWSEIKSGTKLQTIPFEVGESFLRCAGVAAGSFGDVILPRTQPAGITSSDWLAMNIAKNLQVGPPKLSLSTYPGAPTTVYGASTAPNYCVTSDTRTIYSTVTGTPDIRANTNCVDNGTGLTANTATDGLIAGIKIGSTTYPGRLNTPTDSACASRISVTVNGPSALTTKLINNDVLTCFIKSGTTVQQVASKSYPGGPVFSCDIYDSPRFLYQPVLQVRPGGGSHHYSIVDFRPAFITDQEPTATKGDGPINNNGVTITDGRVTQLDVVFFHPDALSSDCSNGFGPMLGGTTQTATRLIN
jgi:Flp pilus assembly protein TadG